MKTASIIGSLVVTVALVFYSFGFANEQRRKLVTRRVLSFYLVGVTLDITATILMIIGSDKAITLHGFIGYSSLTGMILDTFLLFRHNLKQGPEQIVSKPLHLYSRIAFTWWVIAYITGGLLVAISKMHG